jgi:hypothetical protein
MGGECQCDTDWQGEKCDQRIEHCQVDADCSGNGKCTSNKNCKCKTGWGGSQCQQKTTENITCNADKDCNGHGTCQNNICICDPGFTGTYCGQTDTDSDARASAIGTQDTSDSGSNVAATINKIPTWVYILGGIVVLLFFGALVYYFSTAKSTTVAPTTV